MTQSNRVLIIEARFYDHLADMLLAGAIGALDEAGIAYDKVTINGVLEIPAAVEMFEAAKAGYAGYVVLGAVIRGESDHYTHVCNECFRGCNDLAVRHRLALGNGVLTVHNEEQALKRADPSRKNIGGMAARACLRMIDLKHSLKL